MARFIKVKTLAATAPEVLIPIDQIGGMVAVNAGGVTTLTISMITSKVAGVASGVYVVTLAAPAATTRVGDMYAAFNAALTANPGGVVSTVMPPLTTAQITIPAGPGAQGRVVVTAPALYTQFTDCVFAA